MTFDSSEEVDTAGSTVDQTAINQFPNLPPLAGPRASQTRTTRSGLGVGVDGLEPPTPAL